MDEDKDDAQKSRDEALLYAAQIGDTGKLGELLSGPNPADVHAHNDAALLATIISNQPATAKILLLAGAQARARRFFGDPLYRAVLLNREEIIMLLLEAGADPHDLREQALDAAKRHKDRYPKILNILNEAERQLIANGKISFDGIEGYDSLFASKGTCASRQTKVLSPASTFRML